MNLDRYIITADYADCCFCNKPELPSSSKSYAFNPRWNFNKAAREYAAKHNIRNLVFNKTTHHSAIGFADTPCQHFNTQRIRIEWAFAPM